MLFVLAMPKSSLLKITWESNLKKHEQMVLLLGLILAIIAIIGIYFIDLIFNWIFS